MYFGVLTLTLPVNKVRSFYNQWLFTMHCAGIKRKIAVTLNPTERDLTTPELNSSILLLHTILLRVLTMICILGHVNPEP